MNSSPRSARPPRRLRDLRALHLLEGWGSLLLFSALGVALEVLLAFKVPLYVDVENEATRLLWRLAHAHGTLLGLVHIALAWSLSYLPARWFPQPAGLLSGLMTAATLLLPGGFFLAGLSADSGDPGSEIALVPAGALALLSALGLILLGLLRQRRRSRGADPDGTLALRNDQSEQTDRKSGQ